MWTDGMGIGKLGIRLSDTEHYSFDSEVDFCTFLHRRSIVRRHSVLNVLIDSECTTDISNSILCERNFKSESRLLGIPH